MSLLNYRGVTLQIVHTRQIHREVLTSRDGLAYHATRWTFDCDCVFNPAATAYQQSGPTSNRAGPGFSNLTLPPDNSVGTALPGLFAGRASLGSLPAFTDASLRHWLQQPRGQLVYAVAGTILLYCPVFGYPCDVAGGPNVTVNDVTYLYENKTFVVSLKIVATVNEARQGAVAGGLGFPLLLSNRWRQYADQDTDHFVKLVTQGEAVFRLDELAKRGTRADQYRAAVAPNCPQNFHRGPMRWSVVEDGAKLLYQVTDDELAFNTPPVWTATRVEAYETRQMVHPNWAAAAAVGLSFMMSPGAPAGAMSDRQQRASLVRSTVNTGISIGRAAFPVVTRSATVRAWGNSDSRRVNLATLAVGICFTRIGLPNELTSSTARLTAEVSGKFVEFEMSHTNVWLPSIIGNAQANNADLAVDGILPADVLDAVRRVRQNDDTQGFLMSANAQNFQPPQSRTAAGSGTRGPWSGVLQTQTIPRVDVLPTAPPTEAPAIDVVP